MVDVVSVPQYESLPWEPLLHQLVEIRSSLVNIVVHMYEDVGFVEVADLLQPYCVDHVVRVETEGVEDGEDHELELIEPHTTVHRVTRYVW